MTKTKLTVVVVFAAVAVGAALTYRQWFPDVAWLKIQKIEVAVEPPLTEAEVRKSLDGFKGKNLLLLDGAALMAKMLEHPWVSNASIKKEYPDRLLVSVQAKKAFAIRQEGTRLTFIDDKGGEIERWSAKRVVDADLPIIAFERAGHTKQWNLPTLVAVLAKMQQAIAPKYRLSQIVPTDPPYFKVFLASPNLEMLFSLHTWEGQLPLFVDLLGHPPRQIGQAHRINLVFPKKAVVSFPLPH